MPTSARYEAMREAVDKFRKALLPRKFNPTGTYRRAHDVHVRSISFRIIVHAEIEAFIEDRTADLLSAAWAEWTGRRVTTDVVVGLLAYGGVATFLPPDSLGGATEQKAYNDMHTVIQKAQNVWRQNHKNNHGIKEENVLALMLPLGIKHTDLDTTLLADLTSYGSARGQVAHKSNAYTTQYADPKEEFERAKNLVAGLHKLDELISEALLRITKVAAAI
jgi:hypothetical protein